MIILSQEKIKYVQYHGKNLTRNIKKKISDKASDNGLEE